MKLTFIGSGSAFTTNSDNYNSNMLFEGASGRKLLIDCGSDARHALAELNYGYRDIDSVYISHLHADHAGGLEWLALTTYFDPSCKKPTLYIHDSLRKTIWEHTMSGGAATLQGEFADLTTYFDVQVLNENGKFEFDEVTFQLVQTVHVVNAYSFMPSFGLLFNVNGKNIFITTDTQFSPNQIKDFYNQSDVIFHDCETAPVKSEVHAHYSDLKTLPADIKGKIWLYHYNPGELPNAVEDGFLGFVKKGQHFTF